MTLYYRSFNAEIYPVKPVGQIELPQALKLVTYYEAKYDSEHRLTTFTKHICSDSKWTIAFEENYEYWDSGKLRKRELKSPDRATQHWQFENEVAWTQYLSQLCTRWFGSTKTDGFDLKESVLLFHELITEFELEVFSSSMRSARNAEWAYRTIMGATELMKRAFERVAPSSNPLIHAVTEGKESILNLKGFDDPEPNLFGVVQEWLDDNDFATPFDVVTISPQEEFRSESKTWAQDSKIGSITVGEVRANDNGELTLAFNLYLTLSSPLTNEQTAIVNSLFRRLIVITERTTDMVRVYEAYKASRDEN